MRISSSIVLAKNVRRNVFLACQTRVKLREFCHVMVSEAVPPGYTMAATFGSATGVSFTVLGLTSSPTRQNINRWADDENPLCRVCNTDPETLPHILCHCPTIMVKICERHNLIVDRLVKAIRFDDVRLDQQVVDMTDACRPDIVIEDGDEVTVSDVTVPFENDVEALQTAEDRKVQKYQHVMNHVKQQGKSCRVYGFVGSLGAWHPPMRRLLIESKCRLVIVDFSGNFAAVTLFADLLTFITAI